MVLDEAWMTSSIAAHSRDSSWMPPREGEHCRKSQDAFRRNEILTRPEDGSSVRALTAAPSRRLLRGIARERARLWDRLRSALTLT